ncbi:Lrp/AsnC family transcriptional regulator [Vitreoscilla stercoraria]|uniref:Lrp/AsnC family transcriptional regulator n=1 Tax=Vitreoscilla stercoraria TaxID=61 RepID=A0ABY4EEI3_VITST|nr:Lrp/AsnC family transcriptional regulator [Vitreoscilla stercoraria]UOO91827.1 Lrp/AsnC family transcriptional regulator [Vitreoscilla stercoraria]
MLDQTDFKILRHLQTNGRLSNQDLADMVALSPSACLRRVKTLEQAGYIQGYHALLNAKKLGYTVEAFVQVRIDQGADDWHQSFQDTIEQLDEISDAYVITGGSNYLLHIRTQDFEHFSEFIVHTLNQIKGVRDIQSNMVMMSLKRNGRLLPLRHKKIK